jgi:hypothetical protein
MQNGPIAIKKYFCKGCRYFEKITFFLPNGKPLPGDLFYCKNKEYINRRSKNEPVYLSDNPDYETPGDCPYLELPVSGQVNKDV